MFCCKRNYMYHFAAKGTRLNPIFVVSYQAQLFQNRRLHHTQFTRNNLVPRHILCFRAFWKRSKISFTAMLSFELQFFNIYFYEILFQIVLRLQSQQCQILNRLHLYIRENWECNLSVDAKVPHRLHLLHQLIGATLVKPTLQLDASLLLWRRKQQRYFAHMSPLSFVYICICARLSEGAV